MVGGGIFALDIAHHRFFHSGYAVNIFKRLYVFRFNSGIIVMGPVKFRMIVCPPENSFELFQLERTKFFTGQRFSDNFVKKIMTGPGTIGF